MSSWDKFKKLFFKNIAIDLGTANTLILVQGEGVIVDEPSMIAIDHRLGQVIAIGHQAKMMYGRAPDNIKVVRPMRDGVITNFDITSKMIASFLSKMRGGALFKPLIIVCVPSSISQVEKKAVVDSVKLAGARKVLLIEEPIASLLGVELPGHNEGAYLVINIGGGVTELAVVSSLSIAYRDSSSIAGDEMDQAIIEHLRSTHGLVIGTFEAEDIKIRLGSAIPSDKTLTTIAKGKDVNSGIPRAVQVTSNEIYNVLRPCLQEIVEMIRRAVSELNVEVLDEISKNGIILTGGGALLRGLDKMISDELNGMKHNKTFRVFVAKDPIRNVIMGLEKLLNNKKLRNRVCTID